MAGHTKGPWFVHDTIDGPITNTDVRSGDVKWVARCGPLFGRPHAPGSEIEANARLIAACPCLLEALVLAEADIAAWEDEFSRLSKPSNALAVVRAAIARATQP